ncbi:MAG: hypothetical protein M0R17_01275 [Candidatus Omnitrophica bacterium]|jgi:hypothetical protein|nr:hypothetical protein [Candidatus Omnitrophota bacterium]
MSLQKLENEILDKLESYIKHFKPEILDKSQFVIIADIDDILVGNFTNIRAEVLYRINYVLVFKYDSDIYSVNINTGIDISEALLWSNYGVRFIENNKVAIGFSNYDVREAIYFDGPTYYNVDIKNIIKIYEDEISRGFITNINLNNCSIYEERIDKFTSHEDMINKFTIETSLLKNHTVTQVEFFNVNGLNYIGYLFVNGWDYICRVVKLHLDNFEYEDIDSDGDLIPINDFISAIEEGLLLPSDGFGMVCSSTQMSNIEISPLLKYTKIKFPDWAKSICWYNR